MFKVGLGLWFEIMSCFRLTCEIAKFVFYAFGCL